MAIIGHTYDPSCLLHTDNNVFTRRASRISIGAPSIKAHFFYCSSLPIDDPLLPVPPPNAGTKSTRVPPRPFSVHDNRALEEAWLRIHKPFKSIGSPKERPEDASCREPQSRNPESKIHDTVTKIFKGAQEKGSRRSSIQAEQGPRTPPSPRAGSVQVPSSRAASISDLDPLSPIQGKQSRFTEHTDAQIDVPDDSGRAPLSQIRAVTAKEIGEDEDRAGLRSRRRPSRSPFRRGNDERAPESLQGGQIARRKPSEAAQEGSESKDLGSSPSERDTTGKPFLRMPSRLSRSGSRSRRPAPSVEIEPLTVVESTTDGGFNGGFDGSTSSSRRATLQRLPRSNHLRRDPEAEDYATGQKVQQTKVPVGVSRLHVVEMPELRMGPIYWDPVHDVSSVVRGTWFYKETMFPVEADLANQLEEGYEYIKPWTPTYQDELDSCLETGPEAELKVAHKIWPEDEPKKASRPPTATTDKLGFLAVPGEIDADPEDAKQTSAIKAAGKPENRAAGVLEGFNDPVRLFAKSSMIYINAFEGQILNPSQLPSVARTRKPLAKIRKGQPVGVTVVRGFDHQSWEKKYSQKRGSSTKQTRDGLQGMRTATTAATGRKKSCVACISAEETTRVTDLVMVVHGIGQKLSERVESFHFTHAINAFRRSVNMELQSETVKPWLRPELGSIMVLPVNWRSKMNLDNGEAERQTALGDEDPSNNQYSLKDITAESLPAVRNLISDVMLDIPYYLSHHKPKMIEAVIKEANRIYRLWCLNNPGFHENGRVHLIAHSLGSVMALDILSEQPTTLPRELDLKTTLPRTHFLEFDTKSLFFCGSPAGFFLLLNRATLQPRRGREKPAAEEGDFSNEGVSGQTGQYGCLAVDNLYNILHQNDPVAYRVNACVDADYSESLQQAYIPSATQSWGQYFGSMLKGKPSMPAKSLASVPPRPSIAKLPSTVEMETHNFTREEIAEKRMFLLNDNGQIDYTLKSGGGPLEIQYLNMLSAHSSYWSMQDFVRFLVVEIGRKPGKGETVNSFKARKKAWWKK